jgi:hypothetical protein
MSFGDWVREQRLAEAAKALSDPALELVNVSAPCPFLSHQMDGRLLPLEQPVVHLLDPPMKRHLGRERRSAGRAWPGKSSAGSPGTMNDALVAGRASSRPSNAELRWSSE